MSLLFCFAVDATGTSKRICLLTGDWFMYDVCDHRAAATEAALRAGKEALAREILATVAQQQQQLLLLLLQGARK